jgi:hypothetical protein
MAACSSDTTPCDGVRCSDHGFCAITTHHTPQCLCDEGYRNQGPTECVPDEGADCTSDAECDDSNLCTDDVCDTVEGCQYTDNTAPCDDGDICSILDTCAGGTCVAGATDLDADSDGYYEAACPNGDDCADDDPAVNPGATEDQSTPSTCTDNIDNDCDGLTDGADQACVVVTGVFYVRTDGDDNNTGEQNTPQGAWRNIQKAADTLREGETVLVQPGTYNEEVYPYWDGLDGQPITYKADGHVILDGQNTLGIAFYLDTDSYLVIDGFEMTNYVDSGGDDGTIFMGSGSIHNTIKNCFIHDTARDCIATHFGADNNTIENCLLVDCLDDGITPNGDGTIIRNCTIYGTGEWGIEQGTGSNTVFENNIIWDSVTDTSGYTWNYNNLRDSVPSGNGNISQDPLFVNTSNRDFHLSHTAAGQGSDSPCIDAGSDTAANLGLDTRTTRSDDVPDTGTVDLGYHYLP